MNGPDERPGPDGDATPTACPLGSLFFGLQSATSPDAMEHLLNAASELVAAARAALDAADAVIESQREAHARRATRGDRVQRIHVADS